MSDAYQYLRTMADLVAEDAAPSAARPPVSSTHAVVTRGLVRRYGAITAVDGIDLTVHRGEIYGFLGPNGAGKSSLVRVLCTLLRPHGGVAYVAGHDVAQEPDAVRRRIGVALQEAALDDRQSGRELLALQGRLYGLDRAQIRQRVAQVLELVDLGPAIDRRIATYSGGMQRRLDLAAALIHNPEVLFLDEPTTGLDPLSRASVWNEIRRLNTELGMTIFLTTQYLDEADALADRVGIIDHGRLVAEGTPAALKRSVGQDLIVAEIDGHDPMVARRLEKLPGVDAVTADQGRITISTSDGPAGLSPVALALHQTALTVKSLTLRTPTLDDVFMELTGSAMGAGASR
jgi:ABC-2 type transport system ATP-binding protein